MRYQRILQIAALVAMALVVCMELGMNVLGPGPAADAAMLASAVDELLRGSDVRPSNLAELLAARTRNPPPPGKGIPALALVDLLLLALVAFMSSRRIRGRLQVVLTFLLALLLLIGAVVTIVIAFVLLLTMVSLFLAVPFGTIAYLAIWGFFERGTASALLSVILFLKLAFAVCLVVADPRILNNWTMVALVLTSLVCVVIVGFLHGMVPVILVSITDALAAIVVGVIAAIWSLIYLIRSGIAALTS